MHPRSTCSHADQGPSSGGIICQLKVVPDDTHVGACTVCKNNNSPNTQPPPASPPEPQPFEAWPRWAKAVYAEREIPTDAGVGDTVHRRLGEGGAVFKAWAQILGIPCGCNKRRTDWNWLYPYPHRREDV